MVGSTLAHYQITAKLGQGGMGEVYRATDTKLDREVAIKVLPESLAQDAERLARFEREAKTLATLNHPHIAGIYGLEQTGESLALILELVEGEDLSERLNRGPIPVSEAMEIARQVAEGLEAAHEKGIIHRDLKPGNIKLGADGTVKVLDFGLAKALADDADQSTSISADDSPTLTDAFTKPGTILGTAAYMAPEQARGKQVDKRADIWAFGCVMFECLTGEKTFQGDEVTDVLASILKSEPHWISIPADTPIPVQFLLRKCLTKDRKRRLHDVADARVDLEQGLLDPESTSLGLKASSSSVAESKRSISLQLASALVVGIAIVAIAVTWKLKPTPSLPKTKPPVVRNLSLNLNADLALSRGGALQFSPDGKILAYVASGNLRRQLFLRHLDKTSPEPTPLATEVDEFCFSPQGDSIVYTTTRSVKIVPVTGGISRQISDRSDPKYRNLTWGDDGSIVMDAKEGGLFRISPTGLKLETLIEPSDGTHIPRTPQFLPNSNDILFTLKNTASGIENSQIMVLREANPNPIEVWQGGYDARYLESGHLVYISQGALYALAFDIDTLTHQGEPAQVVAPIYSQATNGIAQYDVSEDGHLAYISRQWSGRLFEFVLMDDQGRTQSLGLPPGDYGTFDLSNDGKRLTYGFDNGEQSDIWMCYMENGYRRVRLTFGHANSKDPIWSPDGSSVVYYSDQNGQPGLYYVRADTPNEPTLLFTSELPIQANDWHSSGHLIVLKENEKRQEKINILTLEGDEISGWRGTELTEFVSGPFRTREGSLSPDGNWLAYVSTETGQPQVYVQRFPTGGAKMPVSREGFIQHPIWSSVTNSLLFYSYPDTDAKRGIMQVGWAADDNQFSPTEPTLRKLQPDSRLGIYAAGFEIMPDGKSLLYLDRVEPNSDDTEIEGHVVFHQNFFETLRQKAPTQADD